MKSDPIAQVSRISAAQKAALLRLARAAAEAALSCCKCAATSKGLTPTPLSPRHGESETRRLRDPKGEGELAAAHSRLARMEVPSAPPLLIAGRFGGVFVTLWNGPRLRGCVGSVLPTEDICRTVQDVTRASLLDPRFRDDPPTIAELPQITFEISLLSDPFPMAGPADLICGVHGIIVRRGERSGCFLPKVAAERGWSAEEFLSNCCTMKAGLPADAWREAGTQVLLFTADVFREERLEHL